MNTANELKKILAARIAGMAKVSTSKIDIAILSGNRPGSVLISIVIDGDKESTTAAANRIAEAAGKNYTEGGYDEELTAYFCGIEE